MLIFYTKGAYAPYLFPIVILNGFFIYIIYLSYINFKFTFLTNEKRGIAIPPKSTFAKYTADIFAGAPPADESGE